MKKKRLVRILHAIDIYGNRFIPIYALYDVIYEHEKYISIGIGGREFYKMPWENIID